MEINLETASIKELAIKYNEIKAKKLELESKVELCKKAIDALEDKIYSKIDATTAEGIMIEGLNIRVKTKRVYSPTDWNVIYSHILNTKDFSLLQARLSSTRLKEMETEGKDVVSIGIKATDLKELSITKAKRV